MELQFLGAAGTVTGSKFLLQHDEYRLLVDGGLFQGRKEIRKRNWEPFPISPSEFSSVLVTHAHIDHSGFLPRLGRDGLRCKIHSTWATRDLLKILLPDSARLQEEEANFRNRKGKTKHHPALPLYSIVDAEQVLTRLKGHPYDRSFHPVPGVTATLKEAGHILGAAWIDLEWAGRRFVFSGDIGRNDAPILRDPEVPTGTCDVLLLESTYGDRTHTNLDRSLGLEQAVSEVVKSRGTLLIPAFAVERTQEILYLLEELIRQRDIPRLPVYIDSPMAVRATRLFREYHEFYDDETKALVAKGERVLGYEGLRLCESVAQSKAASAAAGPKVVISASGMATGGRVLHHLLRVLPNPNDRVLLVGFQAPGTRGALLESGADSVKIFGDPIPVRAKVSRLEGFSGHADREEILKWCEGFEKPPKVTFLVHGETSALEAQAQTLRARGWNVVVPGHGESFQLEQFWG